MLMKCYKQVEFNFTYNQRESQCLEAVQARCFAISLEGRLIYSQVRSPLGMQLTTTFFFSLSQAKINRTLPTLQPSYDQKSTRSPTFRSGLTFLVASSAQNAAILSKQLDLISQPLELIWHSTSFFRLDCGIKPLKLAGLLHTAHCLREPTTYSAQGRQQVCPHQVFVGSKKVSRQIQHSRRLSAPSSMASAGTISYLWFRPSSSMDSLFDLMASFAIIFALSSLGLSLGSSTGFFLRVSSFFSLESLAICFVFMVFLVMF